jgi:hypothetical protein
MRLGLVSAERALRLPGDAVVLLIVQRLLQRDMLGQLHLRRAGADLLRQRRLLLRRLYLDVDRAVPHLRLSGYP